jgi:hypothetical protein
MSENEHPDNSDLLDKLRGAVKNQQPHRFKISGYQAPLFFSENRH